MGALGVIVGLMVIGYVQPEVSGEYLPQTQFVKDGMFALATLIPAIGFALSLIPMLFYDYTGKRKEKILAELEEKRAARAAELSTRYLRVRGGARAHRECVRERKRGADRHHAA